jgi:Lar family restriction alleviation protein
MTKLKPCPFCGGEPRTVKIRNHFIIECSKCGITTQPLKDNEVNDVWNARVEEKGEK